MSFDKHNDIRKETTFWRENRRLWRIGFKLKYLKTGLGEINVVSSASYALCCCLYSPAGSLTECYDELGNRYQLPVYCLAPPVNLIMERSEEEGVEAPEPAPNTRREFPLKVRLSTSKDLRLSASMTDTIGQLKKQLYAQEGLEPSWQRWFFSGKLLTDRTRLQETKIQKDFVIQVIINQPPAPRN